jgi:tRNA (cmo5U34)-methyltransferase
MVMDDPDSVAQFHAGGASSPGMLAVYDFNARALDALLPQHGRLLDLGVGSGRALSAVLRRRPDLTATAVDLAPNMLAAAEALFAEEGIGDRVELVQADITALPARLTTNGWDAISCMWTLHQLPDVDVLHAALRQIAALRRDSGAAIWIFDLQRLRDPAAFPSMLAVLDSAISPVLRKDAIASEAAAFTVTELTAAISAAGCDANMCSGVARPLPYVQAHWLPAASGRPRGRPDRQIQRLRGRARHDAATLRWGFSARPF